MDSQIHYDEMKNAVHHNETNDIKHILSHLKIEHNSDNLTRFWFLVIVPFIVLSSHKMKYIQKILANEETLHLILAVFIGVLGGIVNLLFLYFVEIIQWFIFQKSGDSAFLARDAGPF